MSSTIKLAAGINPSRLAGLARIFIKYGKDFYDSSTALVAAAKEGEPEELEKSPASDIATDLEKMGPTFVKFGQLLSTRPDLIPSSWLESLQRLQDGGQEVDFGKIREVIEKDLGIRVSTAFETFDEKPIAEASLAQVHRATLHDGRAVVVKVMRPGVEKDVEEDLNTLGKLFELVSNTSDDDDIRFFQMKQFVEDFRQTLIDELDYPLEVRNMNRLRKSLAEFENIIVPRAISDYCGERVITMDRIDGQNVTSLSPLVLSEKDHAPLAEEIFRAYLKQILDDGFFHADPHPGNIILTPDGKAGFLDMGMVGRLDKSEQDLVLELLVAVAGHNELAVAQCAERLGRPQKGFDRSILRQGITRVVSDHEGRAVGEMEVGKLVLDVTEAATASGLIIPRAVSLLGKTMLNLDRIGMALDPEFDPSAIIRIETPKYVRIRIEQKVQSANVLGFANEVEELATTLPHRLNNILTKLQDGKFGISVDALDEESLIKGIQKVANRITVGLILSALIVGAAMIMNVESESTLWGYPTLAIIFFMLAAVGGVMLVGNIFFKDR